MDPITGYRKAYPNHADRVVGAGTDNKWLGCFDALKSIGRIIPVRGILCDLGHFEATAWRRLFGTADCSGKYSNNGSIFLEGTKNAL